MKLHLLLSALLGCAAASNDWEVVLDDGDWGDAGMNRIKLGFPGKLILSKRKGLLEVLFS